ncbi:uncharacterized protein RHOBADRAFT_53256 [Rhodotorula graminis WP1]|uniref:Rab-GAP TBC domain-containing protein n=1 Tax=Rhodotorula graminis (strain WP1) TaxID=578459 RepID=A0A194S409_RHOGW|nr:uncharacterized protein RHOBADRAFT_53256 [Rhodotorula graminis WP1]KPV75259.1 hypothetical protein RHOBADRAFT_53256 [Rhodotorula graminis WP1]
MQAARTAAKPPTANLDANTACPEASSSSRSPPHERSLPTSPTRRERILHAVEHRDKALLRELSAEDDGFIDDELRRRVWPALLGCDVAKGKQRAIDDDEAQSAAAVLAALPERDDERQVRLDIARSLVNYPQDVRDEDRDGLRIKLERAILIVLRRHPALHYFQGYHDIVSILLLVLRDEALVAETAERLSLHRIRDNMGAGLEPTLGYLRLVDRIVEQADHELYRIVNQAASMPFFALSWVLTLLSHDLESVAVIARLFDFLLAHNPVMVCYLVVAILLVKKDDLVDVASSCEDDPAMIHSALSQLPHIVLRDHPATPSPTSPSPAPSTSTSRRSSPSPSPLPSSSSSPAPSRKPAVPPDADADAEPEDEDLLSGASFLGSSSTLNLDFARSPSVSGASALSDSEELDDELSFVGSSSGASVSDAGGESSTGRRRGRLSLSLSTSWASGALGDDEDDDDEDDAEALHDSMFSDPDIDGLAFDPFPPSSLPSVPSASSTSRTPPPPRSRSRTPSPPRLSRSGHVFLPSPTSPARPAPRTVLASDLVRSALALYDAHPLLLPPASGGGSSIRADEVLGPQSCVFTCAASDDGALSDAQAEDIVRRGEGIVLPDRPPPLPLAPDADADADEPDDAGGFELVDRPGSGSSRRAARRTSSSLGLNLGPHGWLVVGGVAIAGAAVALGVYNGGVGAVGVGLGRGGGAGGGGGGGGAGLGTAGVGLGAAGGRGGAQAVFGGARAQAQAAFVVEHGARLV